MGIPGPLIAELDPAIHEAVQQAGKSGRHVRRIIMDAWVKPGHDWWRCCHVPVAGSHCDVKERFAVTRSRGTILQIEAQLWRRAECFA